MKKVIVQRRPYVVPTQDDKLIEEHFGLASTYVGDVSMAHMVAPPGWSEPAQIGEFDEITYVISGRKRIDVEGEEITLEANQSIFVRRGTRVCYSNPFEEPTEYVSVCIPAFSLDRVTREDSLA